MLKVINLNSKSELTSPQIAFTESVIIKGEREPSITYLMDQIPIFLLDEVSFREYNSGEIDYLGFYSHSANIIGINRPAIGLCLERIVKSVKNDEELQYLIAKVIIHEFAHAKMARYSRGIYHPKDEFYKWMEESSANFITLNCFERFQLNSKEHFFNSEIQYAKLNKIEPLDFVISFINNQTDPYKFGLDLYYNKIWFSHIWSSHREIISQRTNEKGSWLTYVKNNLGNTDKETLNQLFEDLWK